MKTLTIYISDDMPGGSIEEKTYATIACGFEAARLGYDPEREVFSGEYVDRAHKFRVTGARDIYDNEEEWEVIIEGEDADIEAYEKALRELE